MRKNHFYNLLICCLVLFVSTVSAQTISGTHQASAVINFTQLAQFYAAHPQPITRKLMPEPDDEGRPTGRPLTNPSLIHMRAQSPATYQASSRQALLPASPAPTDSFESTLSNGSAIPPDTHGAADSTYLVTAINTAVHIQTHTGANVSSVTLGQFWNSVLPTNTTGTFDPRVHYDQYTKRWIMVALCDGQNSNASLLVAMSQTSSPTGNWNLFRVLIDATGTNWLDFPNVGFNNKWIVVSGNLFSNSTGNFAGAKVYCFNKSNIMTNTSASYVAINQTNSFTLCPAQIYDANEPNMWAVESWDGTQGQLQLWKITGAVGSPTMTSVGFPASPTKWQSSSFAVTGTAGADFAPQLGSTRKIQTNDDRMNNLVFRNGKLWCSQIAFFPYSTTTNPTRASVQWWQLDTLANPLQIGAIDDPTAANFYAFPSIAVNKYDDALIGFTHFSATIHPSAAYALHLHTDAIDSMRPYHTFRPGQNTYYQTFGGTDDRWGDYSATITDPVAETDFWTIQEASATATNTWDTWWAHVVICSAPSAPTSVTRPTTHCPGTVGTYTVPAVTGASTYTWSVSGTGWSGTSTTNTINLTAGSVSATVSVTAVSSCGLSSPAYTFTITPSTIPAAPSSVTLPTAPCAGATAVYTVPAVSGATSYTWSVSGTGWSGTSTTNSITLTAGTSAGSVSVSAVNACGSSTAYTFSAPVSSVPAAPASVTLPTAPCTGATAVYTVPAVTGATSYTWSVSGTGWSGTSTTNTITLTAGSSTASVSVTANNACGSSTAYVFTAPHASGPAAPTSVTLPTAPCTGATAVYTIPAVSGATSYTWSVSGTGWSGTSTTTSITLTAGTGSATVSVTANNSCGSSTAYVFTAPHGAGPAAPASYTLPSTPCTGATATYSVPAVSGATSYTWTVSGTGWSGTSTTNTISLTAGSVPANISVTANNSCGASTPETFTASVNTPPAAPTSVTLPTAPCTGATATYTIPVVSGATSYTWSVSGAGWSGTSTTNSITLTAGTGNASVSVTANNGCGASTAYTFTAPHGSGPAAPSSVTLPSTAPCAGATATYTIPAVSGATSYTWSVSGAGWSGSSTTTSITLTAGTGAGSVSVTANNACGSSTAYTFTAPISSGPSAPTSANLPTAPCPGASATYSVPAVSGATSYTWSVSGSGWSGSSSTASASLTAGSVSGTVSVTANNACGSSAPYVFTAPVSSVPAAPSSVTLPATPCQGATAVYTVPAVSGATSYTWSVSGTGWSGSSTSNTITLTAGTGTGSVSVTANNACGSSAPYIFSPSSNTLPSAATSISQPSLVCSGQSVIFSTTTIPGATSYNWTIAGTGWTGSSTSNSITLTAGTGTLAISVSGVNGCGNGNAFSLSNVPVVLTPVASFSESAHTVGVTRNVSIVFTGSAPAGTTYSWNFDGGNATPGTGAGPQTVNWNTVGTKTVTLTLDNGGCISTIASDTVQVQKTTGINSIDESSIDAINIIPNPASGQASVILNASAETTVSVDLYDMTGRLVGNIYNGTLEIGKKTISFDTDKITSGIYIVKASDGKGTIQKRFVKL